jgi:hypothetical protein
LSGGSVGSPQFARARTPNRALAPRRGRSDCQVASSSLLVC